MQLQAGYIIESLPELFSGSQKQHIEGLAKHLSYFDVNSPNDLSVKNLDPISVIIHNTIIRGLPTLAPTFIEDIISATFLKTKKQYQQDKSFSYAFINDELKEEIFRALHIIDPRLKLSDLQKAFDFSQDTEQDLKKHFLFDIIPLNIGEYFVQTISVNRSFNSIFSSKGYKYLKEAEKIGLIGRNVDFSIELPYQEDNQPIGIAIELEKKLLDDDTILDEEKRDKLLNRLGWSNLLYIKQLEIDSPQKITPLIDFSYQNYFENLRKNYERPLFRTSAGLEGMQIALTPFEVARIQRIIIQYILAGRLDINAKKWNFAVIERDIPGAFLAIQDLSKQFNNLYKLAGIKRSFPEISLDLFYTEEFERADLNILYQGNKDLVENFDTSKKYDLVIDSSILRYSDLETQPIETSSENVAILRSSKFRKSFRKFLSTKPLKFKQFYIKKPTTEQKKEIEGLQENLMYFVKNIFRHYELDNKQLQVLSLVLSRQNTIADLPFVYEKTLLYQICALFQPAHTLVVTPLYTIEQDQIRKLKEFRIDTWTYINSSLTNIYSRTEHIQQLLDAGILLLFLPAEAFHFAQFRKVFKQLKIKDTNFSLVVIDQVQSISPWSSTFNFSYLSLKANLDKFLPYQENYTILGLAFAPNYNAKIDIQKNLGIGENNFVTAAFDFKNYNFSLELLGQNQSIKEKQIDHKEIELEKLNHLIENNKLTSNTLIYSNKAQKIYEQITSKIYDKEIDYYDTKPHLGLFMTSRRLASESYRKFYKFLKGELDILIANRSIALGLDKKDIHNLHILSLPASFEELTQLILRSGRDLKTTKVNFVLSKQKIFIERSKYLVSGSQITAAKEIQQLSYEEYENFRLIDYLYSNLLKNYNIVNQLFTDTNKKHFTLEELLILRIKQDFDIWTYFELQPMVEPTMLYVYDSEELLGYLDLANDKIINQANGRKKELAEQLLTFLHFEISNIVAKPLDILILLKEPISTEPENPLITKLANIKLGDKTTYILDFYNDTAEKISELFGDYNISTNQILDIYHQSTNYNEFAQGIKELVKNKDFRQKQEQLYHYYLEFRDMFDTYRIVYFLYITGVVSDYLIDLRNQNFVLIIEKQSEEQYINHIYRQILPYVTKERALEVFEKIPKFDGENLIHKSINYWIYFQHNVILQELFTQLKELANFIINVEKQDNPEEKIRTYLATNSYAKYFLELEQTLNQAQQEDSIRIIDSYIKKIGFLKANWQHLANSAELILKKQPTNYNAFMLKGWAKLILSQNNDELSKALDYLALGLIKWKEENGTTIEEFNEKINQFFTTLEHLNAELKTKIETLFTLKLTTSWLKEFNKKFIDIT